MDKNKVCVVTGEPRSGTSLMMQTLQLLGAELIGEEYPQEAKIEKQIEQIEDEEQKAKAKEQANNKMKHAKKMNPKGFYEVPGIVMQGFRHLKDEWQGKAIKIITNGVYQREMPNGHLVGTPNKNIDKIVFCLRNPKHIAVSQKDLSGGIEIAGVDENGIDQWVNAPQPISPKRYIYSMGHFVIWLAEHRELDDKILAIDYEDMHTQQPIEKIANHLGINATPEQVKAAKDNIDPLLRRSVDFNGWGDSDIEGALAEKMFDALKKWDVDRFAGISAQILEMIDNDMREGVRWVDTERGTWVTMAADLFRKGGVDSIGSVLIPMASCKYFDKDTEHKYTIERPIDLGDLTRSMVKCKRDDNSYTCEYCKHCFQRGSYIDGTEYEGQRHRDGKGLHEYTDREIEYNEIKKEQE